MRLRARRSGAGIFTEFTLALFVLVALVPSSGAGRIEAQTAPPKSPRLEIVETVWGYDGACRTLCFQPVRVRLKNVGEGPFAGSVSLEHHDGTNPIGLPLTQGGIAIFPGDERDVTFNVFVENRTHQWRVSTRRPGDLTSSPFPLSDPPLAFENAAIALRRSGNVADPIPGFESVPIDRIAGSVTAFDSCAVVLVPEPLDWRPDDVRARWLRHWVERGGVLVTVLGPDGRGFPVAGVTDFPDFVRDVTDTSSQRMRGQWIASRATIDDLRTRGAAADPAIAEALESRLEWNEPFDQSLTSSSIALAFDRSVRPEFPTWTLTTLSAIYLLGLMFGTWLVARKTRSYRWSGGLAIVLIAACSLTFFVLGRRNLDAASGWRRVRLLDSAEEGQQSLEWLHFTTTNSADIPIETNAFGATALLVESLFASVDGAALADASRATLGAGPGTSWAMVARQYYEEPVAEDPPRALGVLTYEAAGVTTRTVRGSITAADPTKPIEVLFSDDGEVFVFTTRPGEFETTARRVDGFDPTERLAAAVRAVGLSARRRPNAAWIVDEIAEPTAAAAGDTFSSRLYASQFNLYSVPLEKE